MKKLLALLLSICFVLALSACGEKDSKPTDNGTESTPSSSVDGTTSDTSSESASTDATSSTADSSSKPATNNTTSSKPNTSSAPGNTTAHTHSWSSWTRKTYAFIDKDGLDERVCSTCSATETRKRTECAIANSLQDGGLQYLIWGANGEINPNTMYLYACHEFEGYIEKEGVPAADFFALLSKCFNLTENDKNQIKQTQKTTEYSDYGYNASNDTFFLPYHAETGNFLFAGYKHNDSNKYTTYYTFEGFGINDTEVTYWAFEIEHNRSKGQPNKIRSAKKISSLPGDMIETDGWKEFEGVTAK